MQVTREDLSPVTVKLTVVCDPDDVQKGIDKAYKQIAKSVRIEGFRPGAAPAALIKKTVDEQAVMEQAAENIVRKAYREAIEKESIVPFTNPHVDLTKLESDPPTCEFTILVGLEPIIQLGDYSGLNVKQPPIGVTMDEIEEQLKGEQTRQAKRSEVKGRAVETGDYALIHLQPKDEDGEGRTFMTVVGKTFPQLDEALKGMSLEQLKELELTFPETFDEKDWAGKTLEMKLSIRSISNLELPDLDDDFARNYEAEDMDELKARIEKALLGAKQEAARDYVIDQLFDQIEAASNVEVSDAMWEPVAAQRLREDEEEQRRANKSLEEFAAENGMTLDKWVETRREEARNSVKRAVVVQEILQREKLEIGQEHFQQEAMFMARDYNVDANELILKINKSEALQQELRLRTAFRVVSDFLLKNANITVEQPAS
ncbi:MAG: trigger factor [Fimbriimonadaceae bacterium]